MMENRKRKHEDTSDIVIRKTKLSCPLCEREFQHRRSLQRHMAEHGSGKWICDACQKEFGRRDYLTRHKKLHGKSLHICCGKSFWREDKYKEHLRSHKNQVGGGPEPTPDVPASNGGDSTESERDKCLEEEALGGIFKVYSFPAEGVNKLDPMLFLKHKYQEVKNRLEKALVKGGIKWYISIQVQFSKPKGNKVERVTPHFRGKCQISLKPEDLIESLRESTKKIYTSFIEYQRQGSKWTLDKVLNLQLHLVRYRPPRPESYIPLPIKLRSKHAIVSVQNRDNKCFMWSVLAALHLTTTNTHRPCKYKDHVTELNFTGISFPVKLADVPRFKSQNEISVNVLGYERGKLFPIHCTKQRYDRHVDVLMLSDGIKYHYCWVKNLDRLLSDLHSHCGRYHHCIYCFQGFTKRSVLEKHLPYCRKHGSQKIELPR